MILISLISVLCACNQNEDSTSIEELNEKRRQAIAQSQALNNSNQNENKPRVKELISSVKPPEPTPSDVQELQWPDLVPPDFRPENIIKKYGDFKDLKDDDPKAQKIFAEIQEALNNAPVVKKLNGKKIKLPGFVVPIEGDSKYVKEFLLVPYYGACIHKPPPPANQTVFVKPVDGKARIRKLFDTVWVTGKIVIEKNSNDLAESGYVILASKVEAYD